jgi:hypothetical protein
MINGPSARAPAECANLAAELSRRGYTYNSKVAAIRAEIVASGMSRPVCRDPRVMRQQIAEFSAIVAIEDKMDAKGCYQRPIAGYDRNLIGRLTETLAPLRGTGSGHSIIRCSLATHSREEYRRGGSAAAVPCAGVYAQRRSGYAQRRIYANQRRSVRGNDG